MGSITYVYSQTPNRPFSDKEPRVYLTETPRIQDKWGTSGLFLVSRNGETDLTERCDNVPEA